MSYLLADIKIHVKIRQPTYDSVCEDNSWIHGMCRKRFYQTFTNVFYCFHVFFTFLTFLFLSEILLHLWRVLLQLVNQTHTHTLIVFLYLILFVFTWNIRTTTFTVRYVSWYTAARILCSRFYLAFIVFLNNSILVFRAKQSNIG